MKDQLFFIPIISTSLVHFFGRGIILPSQYCPNKPKDIQDRFPDSILYSITLGKISTNCCLQVILTANERQTLQDIGGGFYLSKRPIPISRIVKIYFESQEQADTTISNMNEGDAFVPKNLVEVIGKCFDQLHLQNVTVPLNQQKENFSEKIKEFDRTLGGLALMKTAHNDYMNYSENYFSTLSIFCKKIEFQLKEIGKTIDPKYKSMFPKENSKVSQLLKHVMNNNLVKNVAEKEHQMIKIHPVTKLILNLDDLDGLTYVAAIINTYGVASESKRKKIDTLILNNFHGEIKEGKEEGIALSYGINRGYAALRNCYSLENKKVFVKFEMNKLLDYYTIESVYMSVFNSERPMTFEYLNWVKSQVYKLPKKSTDYIILDEYVIGKKKPKINSIDYLKHLLKHFFSEKAANYFNPFVSDLRDMIYRDTCNEFKSEQYENIEKLTASYKNEIEILQERITDLSREKNSLYDEVKNLKTQIDVNNKEKGNIKHGPMEKVSSQNFVSEKEINEKKDILNGSKELTRQEQEILIKKTLEFSEMSRKDLLDYAEKKGMHYLYNYKKSEIIRRILLDINEEDKILI